MKNIYTTKKRPIKSSAFLFPPPSPSLVPSLPLGEGGLIARTTWLGVAGGGRGGPIDFEKPIGYTLSRSFFKRRLYAKTSFGRRSQGQEAEWVFGERLCRANRGKRNADPREAGSPKNGSCARRLGYDFCL